MIICYSERNLHISGLSLKKKIRNLKLVFIFHSEKIEKYYKISVQNENIKRTILLFPVYFIIRRSDERRAAKLTETEEDDEKWKFSLTPTSSVLRVLTLL